MELNRVLENSYTIKLGSQLYLKIIAKEFYCRYCSRFNHKKFKRHREGLWFLMALIDEKNKKTIFIIDGEGESERGFPFGAYPGNLIRIGLSGAEYYKYGHVTCGGWYSLKLPYMIMNPNYIDFLRGSGNGGAVLINGLNDLNEDERVFLSRIIDKNLVKYLCFLVRITNEIPELYMPYTKYIPLLKTYINGNTRKLPLGAELVYYPASFRAEFRFGKITVRLHKVRYRIIDDFFGYIISFNDSKNTTIVYGENNGRKTVYLYRITDISILPLPCHRQAETLLGWEEYNGHVHPRASLDVNTLKNEFRNLYEAFNILLKNRLGDVLFIPHKCRYLLPALEHQLSKITVTGGRIEKKDNVYMLVPDDESESIVVQHPEHGELKLPRGKYLIYTVPYFERGHD